MKINITILALIFLCGVAVSATAQKENALIRSGNRYYKEKKLDLAKKQYEQAAKQAPENPVAQYNLGNAQFRKDEFDEAAKSYDETVGHSQDNSVKEKGYYNKGVAQIKQKKLEESIDSWKNALKLDPADEEARENLQKALQELKLKQPPPQQQDKQKDQKKEPKPQQSKLNKQQVEQLLKALEQKEKDVQDKMNQNKVKSLAQPDKDW